MYYISHPQFNKFNCLFLVAVLNKSIQKCGFGFGQGLTATRLKNRMIYIPVTSDLQPDYEFMEAYMREKETKLKEQYKSFIISRLSEKCKKSVTPKEWKEFKIEDIFTKFIAGRSKGLNHLKIVQKAGINYLGATNINNGVLCFVDETNEVNKIQEGNCIAFIRNGEGSMGYSVYKAEKFIATSDITLAYSPYLNKYTGMFLTRIADRVRGKYSFNYKRSDARLKKEILILPVTKSGSPDYTYMENYMKYLEQKKLAEYLKYIEKSKRI